MPEVYKLSDSHRPVLPAGSYELRVSWKVEIDGQEGNAETHESSQFHIAGERFWLNPAGIESVFPPEGAVGDYGSDLPHIALARDTLPWERTAQADVDAPWLALIVLDQDEAARCPLQTITLKTYKDTLAAYPQHTTVDLDPGQEQESVQAIELPADLPAEVLPRRTELSLLCHARTAEDSVKAPSAAAVVVSKRLPSTGRNTAHLVMLEKRFQTDAFPLPGNGAKCLLISLKSWTFTSQPASSGSPDGQSMESPFKGLDAGWLQLSDKARAAGAAGPRTVSSYEKSGLVPLRHHFRTGESGASWYAGPLTCGVPLFVASDGDNLIDLPARSADGLLWFDETIGMLNVTYAAAWELGRLLAMQNRTVFSLLYKWRRLQICRHQNETQAREDGSCHLPQLQCACAGPAPEAPDELKDWFKGLRRLQGIPYRYLLPDERLLPMHSIRFLTLDPNYIDALHDGALSAVRGPSACPARCRQAEQELISGDRPDIVTGMFLRSAAIAGLSGLEVTANGADAAKALDLYHNIRLSPSIRLYLFKGKVQKVAIRQKTDAIHLSVKGKTDIAWSSREKRVLAVSGQSSAEFAKARLSHPEELTLNVNWRQ
jgi:hypothetical protein